MEIKLDDLTGEETAAFIRGHLQDLARHSPPESRHALDLTGLKQPDVTLWSAWEQDRLLGCGALKELNSWHGEVKSMRTNTAHLRSGVAKRLLAHIIQTARQRGYKRLSLETGAMAAFEPARRLYASMGFQYCEPFADYKEDSNSVFMTREL